MAWLSSCAVGPDFHSPAPPTDRGYGAAWTPAAGAGTAPLLRADLDIPARWWTLFGSPRLSALVEEALRTNADVAGAQAALRQAQELLAAQRGALFPQVQAGLASQRSRYPGGTLANPSVAPTSVYRLQTAQVSVGYAVDVFGGTHRAIEAARAEADAARFQLEAAYLTLSSNVVATAIQEASLRAQILATERLLALQREQTRRTRERRAIGAASELDLLTQLAAEEQAAAQLPPLQRQLGQTRDALTALLGRLPDHEPPQTFELADLHLPAELPVSVPSRLVEQRPDVRMAAANLQAASAQVGVAVANLLPQFSIDGQAGSTAFEVARLFTANTNFWQYGASLSQVLFDGGTLLHRRRAADAALDEAGAQYRSAVILACQNVADTLRALQGDGELVRASESAADSSRRSMDLARAQLALGAISQQAALASEQNFRQAEIAAVQARAARLADTAALFQALGGGWWNRAKEDSR